MIETRKIENIDIYTIKNNAIEAEFISFGARMTKLALNGIDVLVGYDAPKDYVTDQLFIGATVGRFAGRIGKTSIKINGNTFQLDQNENGTTCHHGGFNAFDKKHWKSEIISENSIRFTRTSPDGEGGFPGNLEISVLYTVLENGVEVCHSAVSDRDTVVNLTNHAYFNLSGCLDPDARELFLHLPAEQYLPLNDKLIPTGKIEPTANTAFDFTSERKISVDLDHYFVFRRVNGMRFGGSLYSSKSKIRMDIETNQPGVQIYTCGAFQAEKGKGGIPLHLNQGIALETQGFPDSPNHENFPSAVLEAKKQYLSKTRFLLRQE